MPGDAKNYICSGQISRAFTYTFSSKNQQPSNLMFSKRREKLSGCFDGG